MFRFGIILFSAVSSTVAVAGFSIEGTTTDSTEWGQMAEREPYQAGANASFRNSNAKLESRQARYKDAQLLVDLAYKPVTQKGSGHAERVDGFADNVPLETAISMIMPTGWQLYQNNDLVKRDVPESVSYIGGKPWPEVLNQLGERYALMFHIDWFDRTVMMGKGRTSPIQQASRVRVIAEPVPVKKAEAPVKAIAEKTVANTFAAKPSAPITSKTLPVPVLKGSEAKIKSEPKAVSSIPAQQFTGVTINSGTLHENVVRLSRENSWEAPSWGIDGDYKIPAGYTIPATSFAEAMVKLLMLHPIEADVNTAQRKIFIIKEIR